MILLFAIAASLSAAATSAAAPTDQPTAVIRYNDLDLATSAGQRTLKFRVDAARRATCPIIAVTGSRLATSDPGCEISFHDIVDAPIKAAIAKAQARAGTAQASTRGASQ